MMYLAQVDPKVVAVAVEKSLAMADKNPLWVIVAVLAALPALGIIYALWWMRVERPRQATERAADRKERADRAEAERKHRAEAEALNRQLLQSVTSAAITTVQDAARVTVSEAHKVVGERVERVEDLVSQAHETTRRVERNVAAMAAKMGIGVAIFALVAFAPSDAGTAGPTDLGMPAQEFAALRPEPGPSPDVCSPRCPYGQQCSGRICTKLARPKQPRPVRTEQGRKPEPAPMPVSDNYAVLTSSWSDGRNPFDREAIQ